MRTMAHMLRDMYVSLVNEGFTKDEAMTIIGTTIAANFGGGKT